MSKKKILLGIFKTILKFVCPFRFFLFWLYQMHTHNLDIEGLAGAMANPHVNFRWEHINIRPVDFGQLRQRLLGRKTPETEISAKLGNLTLSAHKCPLCKEAFEDEGSLKAHLNTIHPETHYSNARECKDCGKILGCARSLTRHTISDHNQPLPSETITMSNHHHHL